MGFSQAPGLPYNKLGIPEDGDVASQAISKGKYVIWKGKNYFAKTDILQGETFVEDTNLTEIPDGALNGIADALNASLTSGAKIIPTLSSSFTAFASWGGVWYRKTGRMVELCINATCTTDAVTQIFTLPSGYFDPNKKIYLTGIGNNDAGLAFARINSDGIVYAKGVSNYISVYGFYYID